MTRAARYVLQNGALLAVSIFVGLCILEAGLRIRYAGSFLPALIGPRLLDVWQPHPTRGWTLLAKVHTLSSQFGRTVPYETNSLGLRDREHTYQKSGTFRIVLLGDSFVEAQQVRLEDCLAQRLEAHWKNKNVEVVNLGVSGYGTIQEYLYLVEEGLRYEPDLILLGFYAMNDVEDNSRELSFLTFGRDSIQFFGRPYVTDSGLIGPDNSLFPDFKAVSAYLAERRHELDAGEKADWVRGTFVYRFGRLTFARAWPGPENTSILLPHGEPNVLFGTMLTKYSDGEGNRGLPAARYERQWERAWEVTKSHLFAIDGVARAKNARFVLFTVPDRLQVEKAFQDKVRAQWRDLSIDPEKPHRILEEFCRASEIPFVDLLPGFSAHAVARDASLYLVDRHWNESGHALAAAILAKSLEDRGLVPLDTVKR